MSESRPVDGEARDEEISRARRWLSAAVRFLMALVILGGCGAVAWRWLGNRPRAFRHPPQTTATLVQVERVQKSNHTVTISAMGTVQPVRSIILTPRVSGEVLEVNPEFIPGGRFSAGKLILRIDPRDYELAVRQRSSDVARAQSELKLEMGRQSIAQQEYELLGETVQEEDKELALRKPQLATAQAALASAEAALEKAKLDLERTEIRAPFNALVQMRYVDIGSQVSPGAKLAELVDTDEYWVKASVPVDQLRWIDIPTSNADNASRVRVYDEAAWGREVLRIGTVRRLTAELEPQGRMAQLLVTIKDPLGLDSANTNDPQMILGAYVRLEIEGKTLPEIVLVDRSHLRDGNKVWVMSSDGTLDIRNVDIVWGDSRCVCVVDGLHTGDPLITSDLATPVPGMLLREASSASASQAAPAPAIGAEDRDNE